MELFNKFRETIFLKNDNSLERQIKELLLVRNKLNYKQIDNEIKLLELGLQGEREIAFELKNANLGMYVLQDITINYEDLKAQIDYIIVTKGFCYLVECKNLIGNITINSNGEFKREYEINGKKIVEAIYSPYTQAVRHKEILKKIWISNHNKLQIVLHEKDFDNLWYKPLVVLANHKSLLNSKYAPSEVRKNTIRIDQLVNYIMNDLNKYDKDLFYNRKTMLDIANSLLKIDNNEHASIANKYMVNKDKQKLIDKLKFYRKEKSQKMGVPAYYIFNDEEMNDIIENMPKNLYELKKLNTLSDIKIKLHGNEIIKIINE